MSRTIGRTFFGRCWIFSGVPGENVGPRLERRMFAIARIHEIFGEAAKLGPALGIDAD